MKHFERALILPPERVERLAGGIRVVAASRTARGTVHRVLAHPSGRTKVDSLRRRAVVDLPHPASAWCATCQKPDCDGARYALELLAPWMARPVGEVMQAADVA